jgi:hypothetical protein
MITNNVYYFSSGTSWVVPAGVTGIQVECFGSSFGALFSSSPLASNYSGGSYSKSNLINVTGGSTVYMNIGSNGGDTWFSTATTAPTYASSTSSACLAVGGNTNSLSQIAANCGDTKYRGGNGLAVDSSSYNTASGGQAGPNGNGADVLDFYTLTLQGGKYSYMGGGANGGSSGSLGVPPYGRSGTGTAGSGSYWNGTAFVYEAGTYGGGFTDSVGSYSYINNILGMSLGVYSLGGYGPTGGSVVQFTPGCGCPDNYRLSGQFGLIVITLLYGRKFIVVTSTTNFTAPSDFNSLVSVEAVGAGGNGDRSTSGTSRYGGGGGGAYSKSTSVTAGSITAGSTVIYTNVPAGGAGAAAASWLNVGTNSAPTSNTTGVLAYSGGNGSTNTAGAGATTTGAVGTTGSIFGGGAGGAGSTSTRLNAGGGGGSGGPLGAGGAGGAANNTISSRGGGGGGGANNGSVGGSGGTTTSGNGGTGSSGAGGGGYGNTQTSGNSTTSGSSGPSGGGGGGGSGFGNINSATGGAVNNSVYQIGGGTGGLSVPVVNPPYASAYAGSGGSGNSISGYNIGGNGLVIFSYNPAVSKNVNLVGVSATGNVDSLTVSGKSNFTPTGTSSTGSIGSITVAAKARVLPTGSVSSAVLGSAVARANATAFVTGSSATSALGTVATRIAQDTQLLSITGFEATGSVGSLTFITKANISIVGQRIISSLGIIEVKAKSVYVTTGRLATGNIGSVTITNVVFNFNAVAALYDRNRTVFVEAKSTVKERTVMVVEDNRVVYIEGRSSSYSRSVLVE